MRLARWLGLAVALGALASGCARAPQDNSSAPANAPAAYVRDLTPTDFHDYLQTHGDVFLLDVRLAPEWDGDLGHLDNAVLIPLEELERRLGELPQDRERPIAIYDRIGVRSGQAAQVLSRHGYREIVTLLGGLDAYRRSGF